KRFAKEREGLSKSPWRGLAHRILTVLRVPWQNAWSCFESQLGPASTGRLFPRSVLVSLPLAWPSPFVALLRMRLALRSLLPRLAPQSLLLERRIVVPLAFLLPSNPS